MQITTKFLSVESHLERRIQPIYLMDYESGKKYYTVTSSILDDEIDWSMTDGGEKVRIPINAYRTRDQSGLWLFGTGLQLGAKALASLPRNIVVKELLFVLGEECYPVGDGYRAFAGLVAIA